MIFMQGISAAHTPARSCVQVARLPKDAQIEIEVIALANE